MKVDTTKEGNLSAWTSVRYASLSNPSPRNSLLRPWRANEMPSSSDSYSKPQNGCLSMEKRPLKHQGNQKMWIRQKHHVVWWPHGRCQRMTWKLQQPMSSMSQWRTIASCLRFSTDSQKRFSTSRKIALYVLTYLTSEVAASLNLVPTIAKGIAMIKISAILQGHRVVVSSPPTLLVGG